MFSILLIRTKHGLQLVRYVHQTSWLVYNSDVPAQWTIEFTSYTSPF